MKSRQQGFVLITVLLIMVVVALLVVGTAFTTLVNRGITANQQGSTDAYYVAKAGAEKYKTVAFQTYRYYLTHLDKYQNALQEGNSACGNFLRIGLDLNRDGDLDDADDLKDGKTLGPFNEGNGSYTIEFELETSGRYVVLTSIGRVGRSRSTVQLVLEARNVSPMSNALFVGDGQPGNGITGGVDIYGSAYLTGDETNFKDTNPNNDYMVDENSSFAIHNFYTQSTLTNLFKDNANADIAEFLKDNFHVQKNLCSTLRVKNARVKVGSKVKLGDADVSGYATTLSGVHVGTDFSTDVKLTGNTSVYADLKTKLDVEKIDYPTLDKPCERDPSETWRTCLNKDAQNQNPNADEPGRRGIVVSDSTPSGSWGSCDLTPILPPPGDTVYFGTVNQTCKGTDLLGRPVGFEYNSGELKVFGLVHFQGLNVKFTENVKLNFESGAGFFVEADAGVGGNVTIDGDLLPSNSFPYQKDVLGIIAEKHLNLTGAQQQLAKGTPKGQVVAGVFYAGEEADIADGATVFGSVITKKLCVAGCAANKEASFVKIPDLEYHLPPGFSQLADATVPTFRVASFERR